MADLKSVGVRLFALNADYKKSMKESGDATTAFGKVGTAALAGFATGAAAMAVKAADAYVDYGKSIMKLSRVSGDSVETMSKLNFAAQQSGVSTETLTNGIKFLEKNMAAGNAEFDKLGVSTKNANGSFRGTHDVLLDTADAISKLKKGTEQTDAILKIFGRSGLEMGPLLSKGRDGIIALEAEAKKYGLVLTQDNIPAIQANVAAHRRLDAAMQGAQMQIGQSVLPALTSLTEVFANLPGPIASLVVPLGGVAGGLAALSIVGPKAADAFNLVTKGMNGTQQVASGGLLLAITAVTAEIYAAKAASEAFSKEAFGNVDFTKPSTDVQEFAKSLDKLRAEGERLKGLDSIWDKVLNVNAAHALVDADAQAEQHLLHLQAQAKQIDNLSRSTGISGAEIRKMIDGLHIDSTSVSFQSLVDVLGRLKSGEITTTEATKLLGGSTDDVTKSIEDQEKATKDLLDAQNAMVNPQFALMDSQAKLKDARDKDAAQQWEIVAALKARNDAVAIYGANSAPAITAQNALNDAQAAGTKSAQDVWKANVDLDAAMANLKTSYDTGKTSVQGVNDMLQGFVDRGTMTRGEADKMRVNILGNFGVIDAQRANPKVVLDDSGFWAKLPAIWAALDAANAHIDQNFGAAGLGGIGAAIGNAKKKPAGARASGGPVSAGNTYLVGERGPELFEAGMSGNIVANGAKGTRSNPYEDGSFHGMTAADKAAQDFVESIQRQQALRDHPELAGKPGWGSATVNPFAGWGKADFSNWGKSAVMATSGGGGQGAQQVDRSISVTVNAPNYVGDKRELVDAVREVIRRDEGGRKRA